MTAHLHGETGQGAPHGLRAAYGRLAQARPATPCRHHQRWGRAARAKTAPRNRAVIASPVRRAAAPAMATGGLDPAELRPPAMRRGRSAVSEFVDSHRPQ